MNRKPRSIRNAVILLFAASTTAAFALFAGYDAIMSSYYRGESSTITRLFKPAPSAGRGVRTLTQVMRRLNAALLQGPQALTSRAFLESLAAKALPFGIALRQGSSLSFVSAPYDPADLGVLPAFGAPAEDRPFPDDDTKPHVIFQMDFLEGASARSSIFVLSLPHGEGPRQPLGRQVFMLAALLLLAADAGAGVYAILRITGPLRRVESAALAMSTGDLDTPVAGDRILELSRVFDALETMRSEIRELLLRERDREAERRELIANLSHDLRTPLSAVRGYVDGLREGIADTPEKRARYLAIAGQKIQDLDRMIGQIFLLSTLESKASPLELRRVDLAAFLRDSVEELRLAHVEEEARISATGIDEGREPSFVRSDPLQLRRVVENVVENALRHAGKRPVAVSIGLSRDESAPRPRAVIRIEDDGRGISEADRARVFERFYRGDPSRGGSGMGLGLAIARQIIEAHGGEIRAERAAAGGAAIVVTIPMEEASA
jgi:histidine kinase